MQYRYNTCADIHIFGHLVEPRHHTPEVGEAGHVSRRVAHVQLQARVLGPGQREQRGHVGDANLGHRGLGPESRLALRGVSPQSDINGVL